MTLQLEKRASRWLDLLLAITVLALILFGALFAGLRDWKAGAFALIAAIGLARLVVLKIRLVRARRHVQTETQLQAFRELDTDSQRDANTTAPQGGAEGAFVSRVRYNIGARFREGYVVLSQQTAGFVPTGPWRHLAADFALSLVGTRVPLTHTELSAAEAPSLAHELEALVGQTDGFMLDEGWVWVLRGRWLARPERNDMLTISDQPPDVLQALWTDAPPTSAAQQRRIRTKIAAGAGVVVAVLAGAGVAAWRYTGDIDFLTAGLSFAGLIAVSVVVGLIAGERLVAQNRRTPE